MVESIGSHSKSRKCWFRTCNRERSSSVSIDVLCLNGSNRRISEADCDDAYRVGDLIVDHNGFRRISPSVNPISFGGGLSKQTMNQQAGKCVSGSSPPRVEDLDDDIVSVASTHAGDHTSLSSLKLSPQFQPSFANSKHESSFSRECMNWTLTFSGLQKPMADSASFGAMNIKLQNLQKHAEVGRGSSGVVFKVVDKGSGNYFAVKEVRLHTDELKRRMIVDELRTARGVKHSNIVACFEVFYSRGVFSLVMEFMDGGSLLDNLKACGGRKMSMDALAHVGRCVSSALAHLHEEVGVVHRDVKPGNILLSVCGDVKLADLGICTRPGEVRAINTPTSESPSSGANPATAWVGTVTYMSPERLLGSEYSFSADVWSLGVVLAEAALGRYPYALSHLNHSRECDKDCASRSLQFWDLLDLVLDGPCPSSAVAEDIQRSGCYDVQGLSALISRCLDRDVMCRISARDVNDHPFLNRLAESPEISGRRALAQWCTAGSADMVSKSSHPLEKGLEGLLSFFVK